MIFLQHCRAVSPPHHSSPPRLLVVLRCHAPIGGQVAARRITLEFARRELTGFFPTTLAKLIPIGTHVFKILMGGDSFEIEFLATTTVRWEELPHCCSRAVITFVFAPFDQRHI